MSAAASAKKIEDLYDSGEEFEEVLEEAKAEVGKRDARAQDFLDKVEQKWKNFGLRAYLSDSENAWLRRIAKA